MIANLKLRILVELTAKFGDFVAENDVGRGLVFPYSVGGIIILGLMIGSISTFASQLSQQNVVKGHIERVREQTWNRTVTVPTEERQQQQHAHHRLSFSRSRPRHATGRLSISAPQHPEPISSSDREQSFDPDQAKGTSRRRRVTDPLRLLRRSKKPKLLLMREEKDRFDAMRAIQAETSKFKRYYQLAMSIFAFGILWCVGAVVFWIAEQREQHLTYFEALYFCYVSLLTIG